MGDDEDSEEVTELAAIRMDPKVDIPIHLFGFASDALRACADLADGLQTTFALHANWRMARRDMIESTHRSIEMLNVPQVEGS